jgi:protoheme IX farnesyltransferase
MNPAPRSAAVDAAPSASPAMENARQARFGDYFELTKPRLSALSVVTAIVGYLAARAPWDGWLLFHVALGTALSAGGVATLNQWMESDTDAVMHRTAARPIPSGLVPGGSAFVIGCGLCMAGLAEVFIAINGMAALLTLATMVAYLACYTPSKRVTRWSTEIGAISGALPPLIGWSAAEWHITPLGWILFGILFFWQIPHFMAIAWMYREDYSAVHFPMLPVLDAKGGRVARWSLLHTALLVAVSLLPGIYGLCSPAYTAAAAVLGAWFLGRAVLFLRPAGRDRAARKLFYVSIIYLPLLLGTLVVDRWFL